MAGIDESREFKQIGVGLVTVSDTRTLKDDSSGDYLAGAISALGHKLVHRQLIRDDLAGLRELFRSWSQDPEISVVISTGGTGLTGRDITPEALRPLLTKEIEGFGELFRWLSYQTVGTSTIQSRALGGLVGTTLFFALPGSTGACKDAWEGILKTQLDSRYRPCNFIELLPRLGEK